MKNILVVLLIIICIDIQSQDTKDIPVITDVNAVTVFINGAQVFRKKTIDVNSGKSTIKFTNLSPYLDPKSIHVKIEGEVIVLSVNHQFNYLDTMGQLKELEELNNKLINIQDKIKIENTNLEIILEELTFLKDNRIIGGKNQEVSLLNLKETSVYYGERMTTLKTKEVEVNKNIQLLDQQKAAIEKQINQISTIKHTPASEVVVSIDSKNQTKCDVELSYYVNNAGWFPSYDVRARSINDPIELIYKANIHQNTKEEWRNVKLKLSSSNPHAGSVAPHLQPYYLNYNSLPPRYNVTDNQISGRIYDGNTNEPIPGVSITIKGTTIGVVSDVNGNYSIAIPNHTSMLEVAYVGYQKQDLAITNAIMNVGLIPEITKLNEVVVVGYGRKKNEDMDDAIDAVESKTLGMSANQAKFKNVPSIIHPIPIEQVENQTSIEFDIKTPYTVSSNNKNTTVDIDDYALQADYEYYSIPKIDKDAFLMAHIVNWEKYNLLEGEANIFFENTFVGKSILDVRFVTDTLSLSLGRDQNVIVKRDKIKDFTTRQLLGTKKEETRTWHLSVRNNKLQPIQMTLMDQVPVSTLEEIEVNTENTSGATVNKDNGEVKWKFKLETAAKKEVELKYKVKYPKDKFLFIE